jgi:hypothetical protein
MAQDTPIEWRNLVIYEVYVRNHGPNGTFGDVEADLSRIQALGVDIVWFMPIHPIGKIQRKGTLGSPYSIVNYREVNPEYGTKEDFAQLIARAHDLGLKVMIDVVYNHTAHDSVLVQEHPDWFHQDETGVPVSTVLDWSDVIDLKHPNEALAKFLIDCLKMWAELGVDGFRCDVASLLPESFWVRARNAVAQVKAGVIWLAESVHAGFVAARRARGLTACSDSEVYRAFDLTYDYDIWPIWQTVVTGEAPVVRYLEMLRFQDSIYPTNFIKMRCAENHDQARIMALAPTRDLALAWTAFQAFNKGAWLLYGGQEAAAARTPSLFEIDKVEWGHYELAPFLTHLARLKKDPAQMAGQFVLLSDEPVIQATWYLPGQSLYGVFNVTQAAGDATVRLPDGQYVDVLSGDSCTVRHGHLTLPTSAVILRYAEEIVLSHFYAPLLDFHIPAQQ